MVQFYIISEFITILMKSGRPQSSVVSKDHCGLPILIDFSGQIDLLIEAGVTFLDIYKSMNSHTDT